MAGITALALAYVLSQFYRSFMAVLTPALTVELGTTKGDLSVASGAWFVAFALAQFIVGVSLDRYGPRRTVSILFAIGGAGGAFLFSAATAPWMITAAMALIGMGCAPVLMASVFIFARTQSPARLAILTSWLVAFGSAGNVIGASPLARAAEAFGWRPVMIGLGVISLAVAAALIVLVRDPERAAHEGGDGGGLSGYLDLMTLRALWPIIPITALNYAPAAGIRGLWSGPYLADVYGADTIAIGQATLFMALAMVAGAFVYGPLDQLLKTRKWVATVGNTFAVLAIGWLALNPMTSIPVATAMLVVVGITGGSYGLLMAHARAFVPAHLTGRGVTLMNFFSIGGVGIMQFATGAVVTTTAVPGDPSVAYSWLFGFYALALAGSVLLYLFARDARPGDDVAAQTQPNRQR